MHRSTMRTHFRSTASRRAGDQANEALDVDRFGVFLGRLARQPGDPATDAVITSDRWLHRPLSETG